MRSTRGGGRGGRRGSPANKRRVQSSVRGRSPSRSGPPTTTGEGKRSDTTANTTFISSSAVTTPSNPPTGLPSQSTATSKGRQKGNTTTTPQHISIPPPPPSHTTDDMFTESHTGAISFSRSQYSASISTSYSRPVVSAGGLENTDKFEATTNTQDNTRVSSVANSNFDRNSVPVESSDYDEDVQNCSYRFGADDADISGDTYLSSEYPRRSRSRSVTRTATRKQPSRDYPTQEPTCVSRNADCKRRAWTVLALIGTLLGIFSVVNYDLLWRRQDDTPNKELYALLTDPIVYDMHPYVKSIQEDVVEQIRNVSSTHAADENSIGAYPSDNDVYIVRRTFECWIWNADGQERLKRAYAAVDRFCTKYSSYFPSRCPVEHEIRFLGKREVGYS